jgi:hypothetical protein
MVKRFLNFVYKKKKELVYTLKKRKRKVKIKGK